MPATRNAAPLLEVYVLVTDYRTALGTGLLYGPRARRFLMSEVPLYCDATDDDCH